jgi:hypothetical protein
VAEFVVANLPLAELAAIVRAELAAAPATSCPHGEPFRFWREREKAREAALLRRIAERTGAQFSERVDKYVVRLAGFASSSTSGFEGALRNWCEAASKRLAQQVAA